jgi:hypothetical protein
MQDFVNKKQLHSIIAICVVMVTVVSLFWRRASVDAQTTSERLDYVESRYAVEEREQLYATLGRIELLKAHLAAERDVVEANCIQLKETGVPLNETDIYLC